MPYMKKTNLTFKTLAKRMGFTFKCTCHSTTIDNFAICKCQDTCYCTQFQDILVHGVAHYLQTKDTKIIVSAFQQDENSTLPSTSSTLTMLDCADFIHRLNQKLDAFSDIKTND